MIHASAEVHTGRIGAETNVWQHTVILEGASVGRNCNICSHVFIENQVVLGDNVTVKNGVYLWDGITIEDDVFIGPNATFTNDKSPRSKRYRVDAVKTVIQKGASVGAGSVLIGPLTIGRYAMVGAGAVVTKDVPDFTLVIGNPARAIGTVNEAGEIIERY